MGREMPQGWPFPLWRSGPPPNIRFLWLTQVHATNGIWIGPAILAQLVVVTNTQTDRPRYICSNRPHLYYTVCMLYSLNTNNFQSSVVFRQLKGNSLIPDRSKCLLLHLCDKSAFITDVNLAEWITRACNVHPQYPLSHFTWKTRQSTNNTQFNMLTSKVKM